MAEQNFDQFLKKLQDLKVDVDEVGRRVVNRAVNEGMSVSQKSTPVKTGYGRSQWSNVSAQKANNGWKGEYSNNVEYLLYLNFGHRMVVKGKTVGYVPGKFFLGAGTNHARRNIQSYFRSEVKAIRGDW